MGINRYRHSKVGKSGKRVSGLDLIDGKSELGILRLSHYPFRGYHRMKGKEIEGREGLSLHSVGSSAPAADGEQQSNNILHFSDSCSR